MTREAVRILEETYHPDGFTLGMNIGEAAGAGIRHHLHFHIVPRWSGDTNFLTVTGETRVLPEDLKDSYPKLRAMFDDLCDRCNWMCGVAA